MIEGHLKFKALTIRYSYVLNFNYLDLPSLNPKIFYQKLNKTDKSLNKKTISFKKTKKITFNAFGLCK